MAFPPNLFILGAPKCGTTSLSYWLSQHPEIFLPSVKEPHYYNWDSKHRVVKNLDEYLGLYKQEPTKRSAYCLDASVWYLYSSVALENIERDSKREAKYIVCLRNPAEMAVSLHQEMFMGGSENQRDFWTAWELQGKRELNMEIPATAHEVKHLFYKDNCSLGKYSAQLMNTIQDSNRVLFLSLDEMKESPQECLAKVFKFLDLENHSIEIDTCVRNRARKPRSYFIDRIFKLLLSLKYRYFRWFPSFGVIKKIKEYNVDKMPGKVNVLSEESFRKLEGEFKSDMHLLKQVTGFDLARY